MVKILFIMFQGAGTNLKAWNEYTKSKFLDRLKMVGSVYTYQDKTHNIWHYNTSDPEHKDFGKSTDIDLSYVRPDTHVKMVYKAMQTKYKKLESYSLVPVGFSAGCFLALYFAQTYASRCVRVVLLDPALWTPNNMKIRLKTMDDGIYPITKPKYKKMIKSWKNDHTHVEDAYKINNLNHYIRSLFISQHLSLKLPVPTLAFVNIQEVEGAEWSIDFNNERRLAEVQILEKHNPTNYEAFIFKNKTHYIFDTVRPAIAIIKQIKASI